MWHFKKMETVTDQTTATNTKMNSQSKKHCLNIKSKLEKTKKKMLN